MKSLLLNTTRHPFAEAARAVQEKTSGASTDTSKSEAELKELEESSY